MKKIKMTSYDDIWNALAEGKTVHWASDAYKIYIEAIAMKEHGRYTSKHGCTLTARCISNYFGSLLLPEEIKQCYIKVI